MDEGRREKVALGRFSQPKTGTAGLVRGPEAPRVLLVKAAMAAAVRAGLLRAADVVRRLTRKEVPKKIWSCRFWPTPGRSLIMGAILCRSRVSRGPIPETIRSWGDWNAPAETITSLRARRVYV